MNESFSMMAILNIIGKNLLKKNDELEAQMRKYLGVDKYAGVKNGFKG
jgi:hypothetical protein